MLRPFTMHGSYCLGGCVKSAVRVDDPLMMCSNSRTLSIPYMSADCSVIYYKRLVLPSFCRAYAEACLQSYIKEDVSFL